MGPSDKALKDPMGLSYFPNLAPFPLPSLLPYMQADSGSSCIVSVSGNLGLLKIQEPSYFQDKLAYNKIMSRTYSQIDF